MKTLIIVQSSILAWLLLSTPSVAQSTVQEDRVYSEDIRTVQLTIGDLQTSLPIITMRGSLTLQFDDLSGGSRYLKYRIEHCDADWNRSELDELEYLEGFNDQELRDHAFSINTIIPYTHYTLTMPNDRVRWTKSGNYLLHIYDASSRTPLITRRFMVSEDIMTVSAQLQKPVDVSKIRTHHEIDFSVNHKDITLRNPLTEISATILQNGRWDNAITDIAPYINQGDNLSFDHQDLIVFPAGKEFRTIDFRNLRGPTGEIIQADQYDEGWELKVRPSERRTFIDYINKPDLNGQYFIESYFDRNSQLEAEYCYLLFTFKSSQELDDQDIYVVGKFNDFQ